MNATPLQGTKFTARTATGRLEIFELVKAAKKLGLIHYHKQKPARVPRNKTCENR